MNLLKPQFILILLLMTLVISALIYFRIQSVNQRGGQSPLDIPIFNRPTTTPTPLIPSQLPLEEQFKIQTQADINYLQLQNKILSEFPWYTEFPLQESNYFVYFDLDKKSFKGKIYPQKSSSVSIDEQVNNYKQEILGILKKIGVDTALYPIEWVIIPE